MCCDGKSISSEEIERLLEALPVAVLAGSDLANGLRRAMSGDNPKVHDDGSIEYQPIGEEPPLINGYVRDAQNPFLFHPAWIACDKRMHGVKRKKQFIDVLTVCNNNGVGQFQKFVTADVCANCAYAQKKNPAQPGS